MGVGGRPEGAIVTVPLSSEDLDSLGARGPLGFGWVGQPRPDLMGAQIPRVPPGRERDAVAQDLVLRWMGAHVDHVDHNFTEEGGFPMAIDFGGTIHSYGWDSGRESDKPSDCVYGCVRADLMCRAMPGLAASLLERAGDVSDRLEAVLDLVPSGWATPEERSNACRALRARLPKVVAYYRSAITQPASRT